VVAEVHDIEGRLDDVLGLLRARGYSTAAVPATSSLGAAGEAAAGGGGQFLTVLPARLRLFYVYARRPTEAPSEAVGSGAPA
jgi:hypothetical protein